MDSIFNRVTKHYFKIIDENKENIQPKISEKKQAMSGLRSTSGRVPLSDITNSQC